VVWLRCPIRVCLHELTVLFKDDRLACTESRFPGLAANLFERSLHRGRIDGTVVVVVEIDGGSSEVAAAGQLLLPVHC